MSRSKQENVVIRGAVELQLAEDDPDELQLLDECDSGWVEAWKNAAKLVH